MGPPLSCLISLVKTVSLTILTELWVGRGFDSCGRKRCRRVWSPGRHRHDVTSSQLRDVAVLPSTVLCGTHAACKTAVESSQLGWQPVNRQFLTVDEFLRREMEIIKIVLDCMKENGRCSFNWCRMKKNGRGFWRPSYDRLRGRKGAEGAFPFSHWVGWKETNCFPVTSAEDLAPSAIFLVDLASSHTILWKTGLHRTCYVRCYLGFYIFTWRAGNSRANVAESMYLVACLIKT